MAAVNFDMPVRSSIVEAPPSSNMDVTMMFVVKAKMIMTMCVVVPKRALTISMNVCMCEARRFTWIAKMAKSKIWMVAPEAYQKGPLIPTRHPILEDISNVAAHVHWETITAAVRPGPTLRPAVLNCSEDCSVPSVLYSYLLNITVNKVKKAPKPTTTAQPTPSLNGVTSAIHGPSSCLYTWHEPENLGLL